MGGNEICTLTRQNEHGCSVIRKRESSSRPRAWCLSAQRWFPLVVQTHGVPMLSEDSGTLGDLQPDRFGPEQMLSTLMREERPRWQSISSMVYVLASRSIVKTGY